MSKINIFFISISSIFFVIGLYLLYTFKSNITENIFQNISIVYVILFMFFISFFFLFSIKLKGTYKLQISIILISCLIGVYSFEFYLSFVTNKINFQKGSKNKYEIVQEMNKNKQEAYLNIGPHLFIESNGLFSKSDRIFPLGGISNIYTVMNNELGFYPTYKTDKFGFNNSNTNYENEIEYLLIGDSFVEGCCVYTKDNFSETLNKLGYNSINLGKSGNGPLLELATFMEYAPILKPKKILWFYYPNDFKNLRNELSSDILNKYLNDNEFSQKLILKQQAIDELLAIYLNLQEDSYNKKIREENFDVLFKNHWLTKIIKLTNIRLRFSLINIQNDLSLDNFSKDIETLLKILIKTKNISNQWNGELIFIFLPSIIQMNNIDRLKFHEEFFDKIKKENIDVINIKKLILDMHPNPLSLLSNDTGGHFNQIGYTLIAEEIHKTIISKLN